MIESDELRQKNVAELMAMALQAKLAGRGDKFSFCSIVNAKSGHCSEDCAFCVQSAHFKTDIQTYPLKSVDEVIDEAREAERIGAQRFSIVTSGRGLGKAEVAKVAGMIAEIKRRVGIPMCASLGILPRESLALLKEAGLVRYHHNLESSREFFPRIATTHTFEERVETIRTAQALGLEVCSGGIIGLGETEADRVSLARTLAELRVDSVPINILMPLPGTPLADTPPLSIREILRAIALFRIILPNVPVRLAGGREKAMGEFLSMAFMAGADGMMIGGYLTQGGRLPEEDHRLARQVKELWAG